MLAQVVVVVVEHAEFCEQFGGVGTARGGQLRFEGRDFGFLGFAQGTVFLQLAILRFGTGLFGLAERYPFIL